MDFYGYLMSIRCARKDAEWALDKLRELSEGVPLPNMDFGPHGKSSTHSDRTAILAMARIRGKKRATTTMKDALQTLNEFKSILQDSDVNDTATAATWMHWGMGKGYREVGKSLGMTTVHAMGMVHEVERVIRPAIERL